MAIPKIIHYCWFGRKPIPKMLQYCIASWYETLPDYQFMLWNEDNTTFDCEFVKTAYEEKKWAFVSDYVRLKVVYEYGGVYMDTDMLLLKPLEDFLYTECFLVAEHSKSIGVGVFGAKKHNYFINLCIKEYQKPGFEFVPIPKVVSDIFVEEYSMERKFINNIVLNHIRVYTPDYFYSLPYSKLFDIHNYKNYLTTNSYGVHLWDGSWHKYNELVLLRRKEYSKAFERIFKTIFYDKKLGISYLKKVLRAFKDSVFTVNAFK